MMAIPYPDDGEQFRADLRAAGFIVSGLGEHIDKIKNELGCSKQHARNMLSGWNRYSKPMRAKMRELIDSNYNAVASEPVVDVDPGMFMRDAEKYGMGTIANQSNEPPARYTIHSFGYDRHVLVSVIAEFTDGKQAQIVCDLLNKSD